MWPQLFGWGSPTSAPGFAGGMVEYGGPRRSGLLSRARRPALAPVNQEQMTPYTRAAPGGLVGPMGAPPPEPTVTAQGVLSPMAQQMTMPKPQGWGSQLFQGIADNRMPLLQLGAGLLDVAEGNGSWGQAAAGFQQARDAQDARSLQMEDVDYAREQRAAERKAKADREQWIASLPPDQQALARVAPDAIVDAQAPLSREAQAQMDYRVGRDQVGDQQWQAEMDMRRRQIAASGAADRPHRGFVKPTGRDAMIHQQYEGVYSSSQQALADLDRTEALIRELASKGAMGQPLDAAMRMRINRLTGSNPEARAAYEQLQSQVWPVVLKNLEGLAPVTQVELGQALSRTVNADMTPAAAIAEIQRMRRSAQRAQDIAGRGLDFIAQGGSYATGRNEAGQTWREALDTGNRAFDEQNPVAAAPASSGPAPPPSRGFLAEMIDNVLAGGAVGGSRIGTRTTDSQGFTYEKINGGPDSDRRNWKRVPNGR